MEELKRMLKAIHEENKTILSLLCFDDTDSKKEFEEVSSKIEVYYDELFYGKEVTNESTD